MWDLVCYITGTAEGFAKVLIMGKRLASCYDFVVVDLDVASVLSKHS